MVDDKSTKYDFKNKQRLPFDFVDGLMVGGVRLQVDANGQVSSNPVTPASLISNQTDNRLKQGNDGNLYVKDDIGPDPLAYYILAKN